MTKTNTIQIIIGVFIIGLLAFMSARLDRIANTSSEMLKNSNAFNCYTFNHVLGDDAYQSCMYN